MKGAPGHWPGGILLCEPGQRASTHTWQSQPGQTHARRSGSSPSCPICPHRPQAAVSTISDAPARNYSSRCTSGPSPRAAASTDRYMPGRFRRKSPVDGFRQRMLTVAPRIHLPRGHRAVEPAQRSFPRRLGRSSRAPARARAPPSGDFGHRSVARSPGSRESAGAANSASGVLEFWRRSRSRRAKLIPPRLRRRART